MYESAKLELHGFNNLTKTLSFNIYDIAYAETEHQRDEYLQYIDDEYDAERLTGILHRVTEIIDAHILNIARQDYDPQGASVTMLIAEQPVPSMSPTSTVAHLDKSHITVHTYPEQHPQRGVSTFRADIDVSTCGLISPLKALDFLISSFDSDIVTVDYRVRGFTRHADGSKLFIDHRIESIGDYISAEIHEQYHFADMNIQQENIFMTKMLLRNFELSSYLFDVKPDELSEEQRELITRQIKLEMHEIFSGRSLPQDFLG